MHNQEQKFMDRSRNNQVHRCMARCRGAWSGTQVRGSGAEVHESEEQVHV